jgi:hypothetical protein
MFDDHISDISVNFIVTEPLVKHNKVKNHREKNEQKGETDPQSRLAALDNFLFWFSHCMFTIHEYKI